MSNRHLLVPYKWTYLDYVQGIDLSITGSSTTDNLKINQLINQSTNQSINQSINQPTNEPTNQPVTQPVSQPISQSEIHTANHSNYLNALIDSLGSLWSDFFSQSLLYKKGRFKNNHVPMKREKKWSECMHLRVPPYLCMIHAHTYKHNI